MTSLNMGLLIDWSALSRTIDRLHVIGCTLNRSFVRAYPEIIHDNQEFDEGVGLDFDTCAQRHGIRMTVMNCCDV